ncbi:probable serine/threonine-protein kinase nek1 [Sardina pilchardus]|uniref:probable serine/threonine-protein kinase nek1 n=1 Tax=Sardina pilchardus TaxID=27697 RepID=UPI002E13E96B
MGNAQRVLEKHGYTKIKTIGSGAFGKAILAKYSEDGENYILKEMKLISEENIKVAKDEASLLIKMHHPFIVGYKESFEESGRLFIAMDYCEMGDLDKMIEHQLQKGVHFPEKEVLDWFVQICLAVKYVHDKNIIHRDIKPQNIFVTMEGTLKLGDFGLAKVLPRSQAYTGTVAGTPVYMAPEVLGQTPYNTLSDVWSLGLVLYNMCKLSYTPEDWIAAMKNVQNIRLSKYYSSDLQDLINDLLTPNPAKRPTLDDVLKKPILARRIPKHLSIEAIKQEFDRDLLYAMGIDGKGSFLTDEGIIAELICELKENIKIFCAFFRGDHQHLKEQTRHLDEITDRLEKVHRKTTIGSLTGGVIGAAGGITSIVGLVLAPFTLGASLAVTAVGVGMAAAGGATGAVSNITNMVRQKTLRKTIEDIVTDFQNKINPVLVSTNKIKGRVAKMQEYRKIAVTTHRLEAGMGAGRGAAGLLQVVRLAKAVNVGRVAAQATRAVSVAGKLTTVLSSLMLVLDVVFIAKDAKEIHEMKKLKKKAERESGPKLSVAEANKIKSNMLKFINEMRNTARHFENILDELEKMKEVVNSEIVPKLCKI